MSTTGFRWERAADDAGLKELLEAGVLREGLVLIPPGDLAAPLSVRARITDEEDDWVRPIEGALEATAGARIGVAAADPVLAAAVAVELAVRLGDSGRRAVLIDGSVEAPSLAKALPNDGDEGLVDIVMFGVSPMKGVRRTLAPGVSLVTAGSYPLSASDVFEAEEISRLLATLAEEAAVVLVLPRHRLRSAARLLTSVIAVAESADGIRSLAAEAGGCGVIGILAGAAETPVLVAEAVEPPEPQAVEPRQRREIERPGASRPEVTEEPAVASVLGVRPAGQEAAEERPEETTPPPPWSAGTDAGPVVRGARLVRRPRHRSLRPAAVWLTVVAAAVVAAWFGISALRGSPDRRALESGRPTPARVAEQPNGEPSGRPGGDGEAPGAATAGERGTRVADRGASEVVVGEVVEDHGAASDERKPTGGLRDQDAGEEPPAGPIAGPGGPYTVFVSSHRIASAGRIEVEELGRVGVSAAIVPTEVGETGVWHRVVVSGGYATLTAARTALARIHRLGYEGAWIERSQESR